MTKLLESKIEIQAKTGVNLIISFLTLFVVNSLIIMLANYFFPTKVVLGTFSISYWWAIYHSMLKFTLLTTFVMPFVALYEWKMKTTFTSMQWMGLYLVVNVAGLWAITRFAENLGLGVSAWWIVLVVAAVLDMVQGMAMMAAGKYIMK